MTSFSRKDLFLLALLIFFWGVNWPIMKIGVGEFPPISFRALTMLGGLPIIYLAARMQGISLRLPMANVREVARLTFPNMVVWHIGIILAVSMLTSGRAAILGYTMPVWAVLSGLLFYRERLDKLAWMGIACAMGGALLLLSSEFSAFSGSPLGTALAIFAAAAWGYGTVELKRTTLELPTIALTFWMIAMACCVLFVVGLVFEHDQWRMPGVNGLSAIAYNAVLVIGVSHILWFRIARSLPPVASSLSIMFIPVLGVFSGAWMLNEELHWQDYCAMLLILMSLSTVVLKPALSRPK